MSTKKIYILMVLSTLFWSGAFIAGKYSVPYIPTFTITFMRFSFATVILYFVMKKIGEPYKLQKEHVPVFLITGTVGIFGYHVLFFSALKYTTATNSAIIAAFNPITTVIFAFLFLRNRISRMQLAGIIISFAGVILTITGAKYEVIKNMSFNAGDLLQLAGVAAWTVYTLVCKSKGKDIPSTALTFYSFLVCTILLIPFMVYEKPWLFLGEVPMAAHLSVIYMSIFPSVIGYLSQQIAVKEIGPNKTANFSNMTPIFSIILAVIILGEPLEPIKLLTTVLIIAGVIICQRY